MHKNRKFSDDEEAVFRRRYEDGATIKQLATEADMHVDGMRKLLVRAGATIRGSFRWKPGVRSRNWRGGRRINTQGYVDIKLDSDHWLQCLVNRAGYAKEHRVVMSEHLGRAVLPEETVHHINGDKTDNRIENLQLRVGSHGQGHRYACRQCGCTDLVPLEL